MIGTQQKEIHSTKFSGGKTWTEQELASMFRGKAEAYSQDLPGIQTFQLLGFYGGRNIPEAYQPFTCTPNNEPGGLGTESPTDTGRTQQMMRQWDSLFSQVFRRQQTLDEYSNRIISQQADTITKLAHENRDMFGIFKEMLMEKALNDHTRKMEQLNFERSTIERKKWISFMPALVNTVLGREVFPQGLADTALVESIADSISEEDIMKLASVVKPELMGPLAARMHQHLLKKSEEEKAIKMLSATRVIDPEADAAGELPSGNH